MKAKDLHIQFTSVSRAAGFGADTKPAIARIPVKEGLEVWADATGVTKIISGASEWTVQESIADVRGKFREFQLALYPMPERQNRYMVKRAATEIRSTLH